MITSEATNEAASLLQEGLAAANAGDKESAKTALRRSSELDPNNEAVWLWLASLHTDLPVVAHCLKMALDINPTNAVAEQALQAVTRKMIKGSQSMHSGPLNSGPLNTGPLASGPLNSSSPAGGPRTSGPLNSGPLNSGPLAVQQPGRSGHAPSPERTPQAFNSGALVSREEFNSGPLTPAQAAEFDFAELKRRGIVAGKGGRREEARAYLLAATEKNEMDPEVWFLLSTVIDDPEDRQIALENVLALDPLNEPAEVAIQENAAALEEARNPKAPAPDPMRWELPAETSPAGPDVQDLQAMRDTLGLESSPSVTIGTESKLFARAGTMDNEEPKPVSRDKREESDAWIINGKYRVLSSTEVSDGIGYLASDPKKLNYYVLQPHNRDVSEVKKTGANYIVYEGVPYTIVPVGTKGLTLRQFVSTVGALPPDLAARYGLSMLKALAGDHDKGPILTARKSVTPDTVALNAVGEVLLDPPAEHMVMPKSSVMTTPFLPTEQAQHGTLAPTSDIFAIGALLFFMLTGSPPPDADHIPRKQGGTVVPSKFEGFPEIPEDMARVLATALQPNPTDRYLSAADMAAALKATAAGRQVPRDLPQLPVKAVLGALLVVAIAVVAGLILTGRVQIGLPSLGFINPSGSDQITQAPVATQPTAVPLPPLSRAIINSVDSRRFPSNLLYISALDATGAPMFGLDTNSVKVKENGAEIKSMQLTELRKTTDGISVIVALDTGDTMAGKYMDNGKTAIHIFADRLQPGDHMALVTFGANPRLAMDYTVSKQQFLAGVDGQEPSGKTSIGDAVSTGALSALTQLQGGYTALVIVTNAGLPKGKAGAMKPAVDNMIKAAGAANLPVFIVALDKANINEEAVNQLAAGTGGGAFYADPPDTGGAGEAIKKVEAQLHNVYKVTYDSPTTSPQADHVVEISVTTGGVTQTDKRSYQWWQR
jgi:serine/threonine protein kinase/tetratricopeptide (TPR) repeat protein